MRKIQYSILSLLLISTTFSCKKFLETSPDLRTQLNSKEKVAQLLVSAYPKADYFSFAEFASDNVEDKGPRTDYGYSSTGSNSLVWDKAYNWEDFENGATIEGSQDHYWNESYLAIASANSALKYIESNPEDLELLPYKGEALLARAYAHFMLVNLYANVYKAGTSNDSPGIPYVTEPEVKVSPQYSRGTVAEVYRKIEKDMLDGLPLIKNSVYTTAQKYHFSTNSANAFAARFYLFKGEPNKVIDYTSKIFTNDGFTKTLLRPWNTTYTQAAAAQLRTIFTQSNQNSNLLLGEASSLWARSWLIRHGIGQIITDGVMFGSNVSGGSFSYKATPYVEPFYDSCKFAELFFESKIGSGFGQPYVMVPLFTADELLMNRAEAYASTNQFDLALKDINLFLSTRINNYNANTHNVTQARVASFTGISDAKAGLIKVILDLKRAEFISEGLRWFDIIRHDLTVVHNVIDQNGKTTNVELKPGDPRRVFQLPKPVTKAGLTLNPR